MATMKLAWRTPEHWVVGAPLNPVLPSQQMRPAALPGMFQLVLFVPVLHEAAAA